MGVAPCYDIQSRCAIFGSHHPAPYCHVNCSDRPGGFVDERLSAVVAADDGIFPNRLPVDAVVGGAVSGGECCFTNRDRPGVRQVWAATGFVGLNHLVFMCHTGVHCCPHGRGVFGLSYDTGGDHWHPGFRAGRGARHGGVLDETFGWQANFWLLILIGVLVFGLTWADLGETNRGTSPSFKAQFAQYPELFASRRFWGYSLAAGFAAGAFFAYLGGAPFIGSEIFGLTASALGFFFGAPALGYFFGNWISGRFSAQVGINHMVLWGTVLSAGGLFVALVLFLAGLQTPLVFFGFMTFVGLGNGMVLPNAISGTLSVRPHLAGTASGLGGAIMIGGGATLSALAGTLLTGDNGALPLIWIMLTTSVCSVVAIVYTIWRERRVTNG